jgi:hypothetical protein
VLLRSADQQVIPECADHRAELDLHLRRFVVGPEAVVEQREESLLRVVLFGGQLPPAGGGIATAARCVSSGSIRAS